ncbi:MAG: dienelactone hydrolase family protein [Acidimicrobiia bacterium]
MTRTETRRVPAPDGDSFDAHVALPASTKGPGVLLFHEALGSTGYLRDVADQLGGLGYVVLAPDVFWRQERNVELEHDEAGMMRAGELLGTFDPALGASDMAGALAFLRDQPEVSGSVGVVGHCFGGLMSYLVACQADPDCAVSYYGVGIDQALDQASTLACPALFHFGTDDAFVPVETVAKLRDALGAKPTVEFETYDGAGHAFDNPHAPWHDPDAAARAWERTRTFLGEHLQG